MPGFDLGWGGLRLALVQGFSVAALFSGFGALLFLAVIAPAALSRATRPERVAATLACRALARWSLLAAVVLDLVWLGLEAAAMAGAGSAPAALRAVPAVITDTVFGHLIVAQLLLSAGAALLARGDGGLRAAAGCAGLATVLQAWHLHAAAMSDGPSALLACEIIHVLAAGAWLGSLLPLALLVGAAGPPAATLACRRYSWLGAGCVLALAVTACGQSWVLIGGWRGLVATAYGWMALVKLALFLVLIAFAWRSRFRLVPALDGSPRARRALVRHVAGEAAVGLMIVLAAGVLASLPPGMDMPG